MRTNRNCSGFSFVDLLVIVSITAVIAFVILYRLSRAHHSHKETSCTNNLKQVGLAFRIWGTDNNDKMPMSVSVTNGGAMELANEGSAHAIFMVMSNDLCTPKILFCPNETNRKRAAASVFETTAPPGVTPFTATNNLSYFVGLDAEDAKPQTILAGDDHITVAGSKPKPGFFALSTNAVVEWRNERHPKQGNICLADGSVQSFSTQDFRRALIQTGIATNRLAMP